MEKNGKEALVILGYGTIGKLLEKPAKKKHVTYIVNRSAKEGADFDSLNHVPLDPPIAAIILSTKPQDIRENLENGNWQKDIHRLLDGNPDSFIISTAAGIKTDYLQKKIGTDKPIIRTMSNTAAQVNQGVVGLYATPNATEEMRQTVEDLYRENSLCLWVEKEEDLDAVTAVSGSGTGFVYYMMEALMENQKLSLDDAIKAVRDAANNEKKSPLHQTYQEYGRVAQAFKFADQDITQEVVKQTFLGAAKMAEENKHMELKDLRRQVTSENGTTHAGMEVLGDYKANLHLVVEGTLKAAYNRAQALGR